MPRERSAVVLLGPPGGGKTTVAAAFAENEGVATINTGHLLRQEVESGSALGRELQSYLAEGHLAPTPLVVEVVAQAAKRSKAGLLLFDGFPRTCEQIEPFFKMLKEARLRLRAVIELRLPESVIKRRLSGRRVCPNCGASYNLRTEPPAREGICDVCGTKLIRRKDDSPEGIEERLRCYREETVPLIGFMRKEYPELTHSIPVGRSTKKAVEFVRSLTASAA